MPDDVFKANTDDWRAPGDSTRDRHFKAQPRLLPMAVVWLAALAMVLTAVIAVSITGVRLDNADESGGAWRVAMVLVTLTPWIPYGLLPLVQRRHLAHPEPFYTFCRWASIATATVVPALLIITWLAGPGNAWVRESAVLVVMVLYSFVLALYPQVARHNHAAWLRAKDAPPPY